jgi:hypothetical protein
MSKKSEDMFAGVDPEASYDVSLRRPIQIGRTWVRPGTRAVLKGRVILSNKDSISELSPHTS